MTGAWDRGLLALAALAVDPDGLKGITLRARAGPVRQAFEARLSALPLRLARLHPGIADADLFGGLDIAASLAGGRALRSAGVAERPAALVLPMAERTPPGLSARLGQLLDSDEGHVLILLDEGADPDDAAPSALADRLTFHIDLDGLRWDAPQGGTPAPGDLDAARALLGSVAVPPGAAASLAHVAAAFGVDSLRAPVLALRAARALAALDGRGEVGDSDLTRAAELVITPRATRLPEMAEDAEATPDDPPEAPDPPPDDESGQDAAATAELPDEMLIAAVAAALPPHMLARLAAGRVRAAPGGSGAGDRRTGNRRGRPRPSRPGRPDGQARIDLIATLRAAAPWQTIRRRARPGTAGILIRSGDIRLRRYEDRSDRLLIFVVDASGSAAMARLGEAKGAVEILLAEAYARRDHVALIAFRGAKAETLLPPTRSLVQAKRRLAALPGGGGTPLAAGLAEAAALAMLARTKGLTPATVILTDGRANVALSGAGGRVAAADEAAALARQLGALGLPGLYIDTATRPGGEGPALARALGADYIALPRADAGRISAAVSASLGP